MLAIYKVLMVCYSSLLSVASLWSTKAKKLKKGRVESLVSLQRWRQGQVGEIIWVHCASHGEYEQALPLINMIKDRNPKSLIALTFYSPSGYEAVVHHTVVDWVGYLPADTPASMRPFVHIMSPTVAIWVKNEWWWYCLKLLQNQNVPVHIVSATVRADHYWVKWRIPFMDSILLRIMSIGLVDSKSAQLVEGLNTDGLVYQSGDLRADRVLDLAASKCASHYIYEKLEQASNVIIYGSVWMQDSPAIEKLRSWFPNHIHCLFPHDLSSHNVRSMLDHFGGELLTPSSTLVKGSLYMVDALGMLSHAYRYGCVAYVGGGFGKGIHNVLEAVVYDQITFVGPNHQKSRECSALMQLGVVYDVSLLLRPPDSESTVAVTNITKGVAEFFSRHRGATYRTYQAIFECRQN